MNFEEGKKGTAGVMAKVRLKGMWLSENELIVGSVM